MLPPPAKGQQPTINHSRRQRKSGGGGGSAQWWFVERLQIRIICGLDTGGRGCSLTILNNNLLDYDDLQKMSLGSLSTNIIVGTIFKGVDFRWTYRQWRYRASELIFRQYSVHRIYSSVREALPIDWSYASSPDAKSFGAYHPTTTARAWQNLQTFFLIEHR